MSTAAPFQVYPAIDVRGGRVVRLAQGDYGRETGYADDPLAVARPYAESGATWLHLVDLDAARAGGYTLPSLLAALKSKTGPRVQPGGGVRTRPPVERQPAAGTAPERVGPSPCPP